MPDYNNSWEKYVVVKSSPIEGRGIFTTSDIPEGELVMVIEGEVIDGDECMRREDEENNVYIFWNGDNYIDTSNTNKIKYINHSCAPNCEVTDRNENSLNLVSAKNISKGEELTIDYGYEEIYEMCTCSVCHN
ncbi:MAG: SET domain-containing protein [Melioribacteraceae bacterium]|nr:SET domain-containing protein [Melioribacteraceae bacterium]